jgi:AbrB family looped-hinge helix DNA binding protein
MVTKVSTKGQIVLPSPIRRRLGLQAGDSFDVRIECGRIVLTPQTKMPAFEAKIIEDPITGFPVISLGPDAPILTSKEIEDALEDFP